MVWGGIATEVVTVLYQYGATLVWSVSLYFSFKKSLLCMNVDLL
ncbi:hypothetical protein APHWI1_0300 [Anaplasma phagocytophilum str. ApWI1]|uniref:Uncharacterized protein n=1 Tax=Anaplasma phagocytophilum str. ApWI1 TaxID=1359155 RepID=A0A0F3PY97_ANAPH|nr:hypothetical protein [Anaplasma phagocytophilum]KJV82784.1 hypothetical protein APHHGE2_1097 [Anaplasma phagocytophilum str. HGE2]KJV84164.1 hypothetical protein APHWI1_0300 [Anaplasma phagocytophilum str. ApWI1]KJV98705.1 hypothetical protein OTSANNIE_1071 [Anaplasma phagocytophilum str. Annie]KJZ98393.1 hypothetical protein APHCR_0305 [Anaplasma phagocytophilum str. CR1007]KKA00120.1 hypothetical protein APHDU1_0098 [Anaplasma phagocytophilum]